VNNRDGATKSEFAIRFCALILCLGLTARAEVKRIALFIGMDHGLESESPLKFAARDAEEMAGIFRQSGLYGTDGIIELSNASWDQVHQAMDAIKASALAGKNQGNQTNLFLYFSGHGDAKSLHMGGTKLKREDLVAWLNGLSCELKIVVLDACESGDFLRSKGGRFLQDLPVQVETDLKSRGSIIVSSTSRGELAQESDEYQGAVFTHHLINGLRGLANYNGDAWIGLQEAFEYSRRATSMDMAMEGNLKQNPSFDLDLVGGSDPGLIPIDKGKSWMLLRNFPTGTMEIYDANSLGRVSRVWLTGADSLEYRIPSGEYLFRFREGGREFLHTDIVTRNKPAEIDRNRFQEKVRWNWTNKGGPAVKLNGFQTAYGAPHPFPGVSMGMTRMDYVTRMAESKRTISFGIARGREVDTATKLVNDMDMFRLGISQVQFLAGSRRLRMYAGGLAAFGLVRQGITDNRFAGLAIQTGTGPRSASTVEWMNLYQIGMPLELEWAVYGRLWVSGEAVYSLYGFEDGGSGDFRVRLELEPFVSLGIHF